MTTREIATEYRLMKWAEEMRERSATKESIKVFCERKGISRNTYFYWQRKIREIASQKLLPVPQTELPPPIVPKGWALCEVDEPKSEPKSGAVTIEIGKGRVTADETTDPELLEKVCRILSSIC